MTTEVSLWRIEFCLNNLGVWDQEWFRTEEEAERRFQDLCRQGCNPDRDDGSWGSIYKPEKLTVELSLDGLLHFAQRYACDQTF